MTMSQEIEEMRKTRNKNYLDDSLVSLSEIVNDLYKEGNIRDSDNLVKALDLIKKVRENMD